jgi:hypothetical protein
MEPSSTSRKRAAASRWPLYDVTDRYTNSSPSFRQTTLEQAFHSSSSQSSMSFAAPATSSSPCAPHRDTLKIHYSDPSDTEDREKIAEYERVFTKRPRVGGSRDDEPPVATRKLTCHELPDNKGRVIGVRDQLGRRSRASLVALRSMATPSCKLSLNLYSNKLPTENG